MSASQYAECVPRAGCDPAALQADRTRQTKAAQAAKYAYTRMCFFF